jgi:Leucine-rich repeat (LRR) protein
MDISTIDLLNEYPNDITELDKSKKNIKGILDLSKFCKLTKLNCSRNNINQIINSPISLLELYCSFTQIKNLDNLPNSLTKLYCSFTKIKNLDNLPNSLTKLYCSCTKNK